MLDFYIVKIDNISPSPEQTFPFSNEDLVACFMQNEKFVISKGIDPWTSEPKYEFQLGAIGEGGFLYGERLASSVKFYARVKDS